MNQINSIAIRSLQLLATILGAYATSPRLTQGIRSLYWYVVTRELKQPLTLCSCKRSYAPHYAPPDQAMSCSILHCLIAGTNLIEVFSRRRHDR